MKAYKLAMKIPKSSSHLWIRNQLQVKTTEELRKWKQERVWWRTEAITDPNHPMKQWLNSIKVSNDGRGDRRKPHLEWDLKQSIPKAILDGTANKQPPKSTKFVIPQYLHRSNPGGWITTRIKMNQAWGWPYGPEDSNVDLGCGYPKCKQKVTNSQHILFKCPRFAKDRTDLKTLLTSHRVPWTLETILGDLHMLKKEKIRQQVEI